MGAEQSGVLFLASVVALCLVAWAGAAEDVPRGVAKKPWAEALGNHRARLRVAAKADAVWAHIPWRRPDAAPEKKNIIVVDAATNQPGRNLLRVRVDRGSADLVFQPATAPGEYLVYYMPNKVVGGRSFPNTAYPPPENKADPAWAKRHAAGFEKLPRAEVTAIEARSAFHRFDPMAVIATADEVAAVLAQHPDAPWLLFPEDRKHPIRLRRDLPLRWIRSGPRTAVTGTARQGEFFTFQVGILAARQDVADVEAALSDLRKPRGRRPIPAAASRCFNLGGTDWLGQPFRKALSVPKGTVQPLWFGIQVPRDTPPGDYAGTVTLKAKGLEATLPLELAVAEPPIEECGDNELWRLARLRWLDSTIAVDDEVVAPLTPLKARGRTVACLGRQVAFGPLGLPESIHTTFPMTVDRVDAPPREILARPMAFVVETPAGPVAWESPRRARVLKSAPGTIVRETQSAGGPFRLTCQAKMEADGYINFRLALAATAAARVEDIRLEIPIRSNVARYLIGMGKTGGTRPEKWQWKWDRRKHQDSLWVGDVNAGLQCKLKGPNYAWPLVNIHYHHKPLDIPEAWHNGGKGGCTVSEAGDAVVVRAFSGPREIAAGQELRFDLGLLVTPTKPIDLAAHWKTRYFHATGPPEKALAAGANVINIHHGNPLNPYINYPFLAADKLAAYVADAHAKGAKVKIYYTLRELSNHIAEMWAVRSLNNEVFADGPGGGYSWLHEHLGTGYVRAWHHWFPSGDVDAALVTSGLSRWHNYYLHGLDWLCRHVGIDGLYLDDVGYDREVMKRVRKILDRRRPGSLIDFHSWNHFNGRAGFANCANLYMELLPYLDSLWFGEGFNYNQPPDYWLIEIAGIPYGLMGEMLQGGGNPWRGMVYGMTARLPWAGNPRAVWKVWDDFGIHEARMLGYWVPACPVKTGHKDVLATVYAKKGRALIALASWAKGPARCRLAIDWKALGLDPANAALTAPAVPGFQEAMALDPAAELTVPPGRGFLLVLGEP